MSTCEINFYAVPAKVDFDTAKAKGYCKTHDFDMSERPLKGRETCPIGKIEDATNHALNLIQDRLQTGR